MPEKESSPRPQGGAGAYVSQNYGRLKRMKDPFYEKDDASVENYASGGRNFYIFSNMEGIVATWSDGEALTMSIFGNISVDELKNMIDSIGG